MTMRGGLVSLLLVVGVAAPSHAQTSEELVERGVAAGADAGLLEALQARAHGAGLDAALTARMLATAVAAAEADLPSRLLLQKGLEGLSKGVPPDRIVVVMADLHGALERARGLVEPWLERPGVLEAVVAPGASGGAGSARATLVESAGLALQAGASEGAIRGLLDRIPRGLRAGHATALEVGVALEVLPELPVTARDPRVAAELVIEALNSGFGAAELRELPAALQAAARRGQLPAEAVAQGAMVQMRDHLPAATVLQNLFQGDFPGNVPFDLPPGIEKARERGKGPPPEGAALPDLIGGPLAVGREG